VTGSDPAQTPSGNALSRTRSAGVSTEPWEKILALEPEDAYRRELTRRYKLVEIARPDVKTSWPAKLILAADQVIITPNTRVADAARAHAAGDDVRTVIAGYHWFTDWGRDTMISLEGLTLVTGRYIEAGYILRTFAYYVRDGLIPNMFPEGEQQGLYHTADAAMWYFHALERYLAATGDRDTLELLYADLASRCHDSFKRIHRYVAARLSRRF